MSFPFEKSKIVSAIAPVSMLSSVAGDWVSLKNTNSAYIVVHINQAASGAIQIIPYQATAVAGTGAAVFSTAHPLNIWLCNDSTADGTYVKQTAAPNYTCTTSTGEKIVVFEVPAGEMNLASTFDCLGLVIVANTSASFGSALYYLNLRYGESDPPCVITD